jgi:hypothetical protein
LEQQGKRFGLNIGPHHSAKWILYRLGQKLQYYSH